MEGFKGILQEYGVFFMLIVIALSIIFGYSIETRWLKLIKNSTNIQKLTNKLNVQYGYSNDMKETVKREISELYEQTLRYYVKSQGFQITEKQIKADVEYYILISIATCDIGEDIAVNRYMLTNDLYRYVKIEDWEFFKDSVFKLIMVRGTNVMVKFYDDSKVIMPRKVWLQLAGKDIAKIIKKQTYKLLEGLKTESILYHNLEG